MAQLPAGKLPPDLLRAVLERHVPGLLEAEPSLAARVLVGPGPGEDAAVLLGPEGDALVVTSDPITFVSDDLGWYVVQVNANDIAAMGGEPEFLVVTVLLPEGETDAAGVERIFAQTAAACRELGIVLVGGHTEITPAVRQPVAVGQMLGRVAGDRILSSSGVRPGDDVLITKGFPVEGVTVIAELRSGQIQESLGEEFLSQCLAFLRDPGICVVRDSRVLRSAAAELDIRLGAMHDPTEGGVATALWELAEASGVGMQIDEGSLPLLSEGKRLCALLDLNPLGVIASGCLLASCEGGRGQQLAERAGSAGLLCHVIGHATDRAGELLLIDGDDSRELPRFDSDEVTRLI
jgi:hydrogenase expression/formation protein HypE